MIRSLLLTLAAGSVVEKFTSEEGAACGCNLDLAASDVLECLNTQIKNSACADVDVLDTMTYTARPSDTDICVANEYVRMHMKHHSHFILESVKIPTGNENCEITEISMGVAMGRQKCHYEPHWKALKWTSTISEDNQFVTVTFPEGADVPLSKANTIGVTLSSDCDMTRLDSAGLYEINKRFKLVGGAGYADAASGAANAAVAKLLPAGLAVAALTCALA